MPSLLDLERNPPLSSGVRLLRYASAGLCAGLMLGSIASKEDLAPYVRMAAFETMALAYAVAALAGWRRPAVDAPSHMLTAAAWALAGLAFVAF